MQMRRKDREVSDIKAIEEIINKCRVCHLAMVDNGKPYVVPLNYGYRINGSELTLYFHSAKSGRKLNILQKNPAVCFEMAFEGSIDISETPCNSGYFFESVHGFGEIEFIDEPIEKCEALSLLMKLQADWDVSFSEKQADSVCVFKLTTTDFTGKKKPKP